MLLETTSLQCKRWHKFKGGNPFFIFMGERMEKIKIKCKTRERALELQKILSEDTGNKWIYTHEGEYHFLEEIEDDR